MTQNMKTTKLSTLNSLGGKHYIPMTCNEVGNSIYIKDSTTNTTKFKIYHGERYSQDVNKNCHALPTQQQMASSMLGPLLQQ
jgi:hypothetical protein